MTEHSRILFVVTIVLNLLIAMLYSPLFIVQSK